MNDPEKLRELACWYREFAERTDNPTIWDARLRAAEDLEAEAARIEKIRRHSNEEEGCLPAAATVAVNDCLRG